VGRGHVVLRPSRQQADCIIYAHLLDLCFVDVSILHTCLAVAVYNTW
jgi:hypothetical protein